MSEQYQSPPSLSGSQPLKPVPVAEGGVIESPAAPEVEEDRFVTFLAERIREYRKDPSANVQAALAAVQVESTLRLAEEVAALRVSVENIGKHAVESFDPHQFVTMFRMATKMLENLAKSDKERARGHQAQAFQDTMAGHAAEAQNQS